MRVVAGSARGHKLFTPEGLEVRPTADRVKAAIFSSIGDSIYDTVFLDLFSGSGAIGIEALSRGAKTVCFVENNKAHSDVIIQNLGHVKKALPHDNYMLIVNDVIASIKNMGKKGEKYDIIFMDPPYRQDFTKKAVKAVCENNIMAGGGMMVIEQGADEEPPNLDCVKLIKKKKYGKTAVYYIMF